MNQHEKELVGRVLQWAYRGADYNQTTPKDYIDKLVYQFDCHDWDREVKEWGNGALMLDPIAYEPNEGATWEDECGIYRARLLRRIGQVTGDSEPFKGRTEVLMRIYETVGNYKRSKQ